MPAKIKLNNYYVTISHNNTHFHHNYKVSQTIAGITVHAL